uniref:NADH dehydrogenase subunit 2 n=1 Tax=Varestrongylus eleguneniensis TaxID=1258553 RepID=UPI00226CFBD0|nr:NADH dehydrogenase subunit 2 [Varestrongylus eleguneniensis]UZM11417.1 NADH dehydrogenase subunit 2 [Varestrongylus eleguneniensis]
MYILLSMFVLLLSMMVVLVSNIFFWWAVFLMMTVFIILMNKKLMSGSVIFNYFVLQESLGLVFLLLFWGLIPMIVLMIKVGMAPLHFWVFKVINGMINYNMIWFLTVHKLPFLLVFLQLYNFNLVYLLLLGLLVCFLQMYVMKVFKNLLVLSSIESFNWIVMGLVMSFFNVLVLFFYYLIMMIIMIYKFDLEKSVGEGFSWELIFVFLNMPFSVSFFIKVFFLMEILKNLGIYVVFLLFMMFLSVLSLAFWLVVISTKSFSFGKYSIYQVVFLLPLMMLVVVL